MPDIKRSNGLNIETIEWDAIRSQTLYSLVNLDKGYMHRHSDTSRTFGKFDGYFENWVILADKTSVENLQLTVSIMLLGGLVQNINTSPSGHEDKYSELMALIIKHNVEETIQAGKGGSVDTGFLIQTIDYVNRARNKSPEGSPLRENFNSIMRDLATLFTKYMDGSVLDEQKLRNLTKTLDGASIKTVNHREFIIELRSKGDETGLHEQRIADAFTLLQNERPQDISLAGNIIKVTPRENSQLERILGELNAAKEIKL